MSDDFDDEYAVDPNNPFTIHEALHMAAFLEGSVSAELCEHPAISVRPEWKILADEAAEALAALYQLIGAYEPEGK